MRERSRYWSRATKWMRHTHTVIVNGFQVLLPGGGGVFTPKSLRMPCSCSSSSKRLHLIAHFFTSSCLLQANRPEGKYETLDAISGLPRIYFISCSHTFGLVCFSSPTKVISYALTLMKEKGVGARFFFWAGIFLSRSLKIWLQIGWY